MRVSKGYLVLDRLRHNLRAALARRNQRGIVHHDDPFGRRVDCTRSGMCSELTLACWLGRARFGQLATTPNEIPYADPRSQCFTCP